MAASLTIKKHGSFSNTVISLLDAIQIIYWFSKLRYIQIQVQKLKNETYKLLHRATKRLSLHYWMLTLGQWQLQRWNLTTIYSLLNPLALWLVVLCFFTLFTLTRVSSSNFPLSSIDSWLKRFSPSSMLCFTSAWNTHANL